MKTYQGLAASSALATILLASPTVADVTPSDVWGDMKKYMSDFGYSVTATETVSGNDIRVTDIILGMPLPEEAGQMKLTLGEMSFEDNGDGTVNVALPPRLPMIIDVDVEGDKINARIDYVTEDFDMDVSGTASNMVYDYSAASVEMSLAEVTVDGEAAPPGMVRAVVTLAGLAGNSTMVLGNLRTIGQTMKADGLSYDVRVAPPGEGEFSLKGNLAGLASNGTTTVPFEMDMEDLTAALRNGFGFVADLTHTGGSTEFFFNDDGEITSGSSTSTGGSFGVKMDEKSLGYSIGGKGMAMALQGGEIPFPVNLNMAELLIDFGLPISKGEMPQDADVNLRLVDFQMSDILWSIVDGQGILPRDPATVIVDLSGKVQMLVDLLDPAQMEAVERGQMIPAMPDSLALNELRVSAAGAEVTGTGAVTFDPSDMQTIPGVPRPTGEVNLSVNGANGLIDKLIQMGLMKEEDAMGARMMMSMFTVPGEGEDSLKSKIEMNDQGHILANGQRIR